jgi:hypothetical protein
MSLGFIPNATPRFVRGNRLTTEVIGNTWLVWICDISPNALIQTA